jgi:phage terminase small subunit
MVGRPKVDARAYKPHKFEGKLTMQQRIFAEELIADPFMSVTEAAKRAGYSEATAQVQGSKLLKHPVISRMIGHALNERLKRTQISQDEVLNILINAVTLDPCALFDQQEDGTLTFKELTSIPPEVRMLITDLDCTTKTRYLPDGEPEVTTRIKVKWLNKEVAVQLLMRHLGMIEPSTKGVDVNVSVNIVSQLREVIAQRGAKVVDGNVIKQLAQED